ncbi:MAG: hypothetical protein J6V80_02950 [Clostridia bacterium]|nr:hypothetical protein [Clostridia bacterium]
MANRAENFSALIILTNPQNSLAKNKIVCYNIYRASQLNVSKLKGLIIFLAQRAIPHKARSRQSQGNEVIGCAYATEEIINPSIEG